MKNGPPLFSSFNKKSKEPLTKDYLFDHKLSISTTTIAGLVILRSTAIIKDDVSTVDIGAVYKSKNTSIVANIDSQSNVNLTFVLKKIVPVTSVVALFNLRDFESGKIATTLTFTEIVPSTNAIASFHLHNFRSSKLKVQYFHHHATLTSKLAINEAPTIGVSATIGTSTVAMGAKVAYETSSSKLVNFAVGINVKRQDSTASLVLGDNGDTIRALYRYRFDVLKKTAAAMEITRRLSTNETEFMVGGCYVFNNQTLVKAKLDNCGKLATVLQHKIIRKSFFSLSSELDTKVLHKTPKFGLALVLKP